MKDARIKNEEMAELKTRKLSREMTALEPSKRRMTRSTNQALGRKKTHAEFCRHGIQ